MAECAECGPTSPLTFTGDGTPEGWAYLADAGITLCPLHRPRMPDGWRDVIRIYKKGELAGDPKPPPPAGAFDDEE
ncbi:hypothetical protein D6T63_17955 [Arthrobacter cheniae]|uniref:Uncharacterized protein n=1 Tax=Arthrobacter cheniae TaxID=1258888 RepID=A0A3A5M2I2_9MICC|nr:hypothetical protein D6T63_17955 [Arthrobacter cheniae]